MKEFSEMSQSEINKMSKDEFQGVSPFEKKSCYDCGYLKSAMSWWCTNKEAIKSRGTSLPGCIKCKFWIPDWNVIDLKYKTPGNGYSEPIKPFKTIAVKIPWYKLLLLKLFS